MEFDKNAFAELVKKAKGNRSLRDYSATCGVSTAHISNFINKKNRVAPDPDIIQMLASVAVNGVTYEDLMIAAGRISTPSLFPAGLPEGYCDLSFLEVEVMEWVKNPKNAEYIRFAYRSNKKGITKEVLPSATLIIHVNN